MDIKKLKSSIKDLAQIAKDESISEIEISTNDVSIRINLGSTTVNTVAIPQVDPGPNPKNTIETTTSISEKSPMVGTVYTSSEPGKPPFVKVGDTIKKDQVICIIEAMKLFNEVKATQSGTVTKIHFKDGEPVEFGQPLLDIDPAS